MKKFIGLLLGLLLVFVVFGSASATNLILNGNFDDGLDNWIYTGDVDVESGQAFPAVSNIAGNYAVLGSDRSYGEPHLWQQFYVAPEVSELSITYDAVFTGHDYYRNFGDGFYTELWTLGLDFEGYVFDWISWDYDVIAEQISTNGDFEIATSITLSYVLPDNLYDENPNVDITFSLNENGGKAKRINTQIFIDNVVVDDGIGAPAPVPEPATMLLFGTGLVGLIGSRLRKKKK